MDETTQSRTSDAAATRKRRSSILKSQRPPRTPFCELEFNVSTPPDTTKSRRVSFSRRTGVAEFVTNEATTTWKNFYEEHNKSLESSGNDSESKGQPIAHLGKRIFDQQFEEVEAVDFMGTLNPGINISSSINNVNFSQQMEYTDTKPTAPQNNFELSAFTEQQSKLFGDDLAITTGEQSDRIDINFSTMQQIGEKDDLDEIQKDLQRQSSNVVCHGPFSDRQNLSEYIEVDLNMTHVAMRNDESDMSITDTIHSPKVQDVSKSCSIDKKICVNNDWVMDKENIVVNPYVTPRESVNFAINEEPDKVLVFDGKKLIMQTEESKNENYRQTLLPNPSEKVPQRKTIVLNCNDDLPNFMEDPQVSSSYIGVTEMKRSVIFDDMSFTQPRLDETKNKQRTIIYDDDLGDISVTRAVNNAIPNIEKRRTVVFENDNANISITQAVPSNIIDKEKRRTIASETDNISVANQLQYADFPSTTNERRRTIVYENEAGNISITQSLPVNIVIPENNGSNKRRTIVFENGTGNVSITQAIPNIVIKETESVRMVLEDSIGNISVSKPVANVAETERTRTVVFENDTCNISVTQAVPSNIILPLKLNATSHEDCFNISMTQAVPTNILIANNSEQNRRRTVVYENDTGNLSITQAVPSNQLIQGLSLQQHKTTSSDIEVITNDVLHVNKQVGVNKNRTVVFDNDDFDISMTQAVNLNQVLPGLMTKSDNLPPTSSSNGMTVNKRRTIVFEDDAADISMTQAVSNQVIQSINRENQNDHVKATNISNKDINKIGTVVFGRGDIPMTQSVVLNQLLEGLVTDQKEKVSNEELEISTSSALHISSDRKKDRRRTIMYNTDEGDISMTQAIPANIIFQEPIERKKTVVLDNSADVERNDILMEIDKLIDAPNEKNNTDLFDISMIEAVESERIGTTKQYEGDASIIQEEPQKLSPNSTQKKRLSLTFDENVNTTKPKPIPADLSQLQNEICDMSLKKEQDPTLVKIKNVVSDITVYQAVTVTSNLMIETAETEKGDFETRDSVAIAKEGDNASATKITDETMANDSAIIGSEILKLKETENVEQEDICNEKHEVPSETSVVEQKESVLKMPDLEPNPSMINDNLTPTCPVEGVADKKNTSKHSLFLHKPEQESSDDALFFITKDSDETVSDGTSENEKDDQPIPICDNSPLPIEFKEDPELVDDLQKKITDLKSILRDDLSPKFKNRHHKTSISLNASSKDLLENSKKDLSMKMMKSFKMANDTNELLNMISDLTDKRLSTNLGTHLEESEEAIEPVRIKGHLAIENKEETEPPPRRLSFAPKRQSIVMSREDLLNNISMAGAALQKSRFELDESDSIVDITKDTPEPDVTLQKSVRLSAEVVKTLHFEDDSASETRIYEEADDVKTPLRKTAFGEISYMKENKSKVIPDYLENVSEGIKELMDDLVKPMADVLPFEMTDRSKNMKKRASTCSTQVQANLITSSQIDITSELYSNQESVYDVHKINSVDIITEAVNRSMTRAQNPINVFNDKSSELELGSKNYVSPSKKRQSNEAAVLIFDHHNPLNNVFLPPPRDIEVHRYNPGETPVSEEDQPIYTKQSDSDGEVGRISTHYHVESIIPDNSKAVKFHAQNIPSRVSSAPISIDEAIDAKPDLKDNEVNTAIAMKDNMELLKESSSLTLVDETSVWNMVNADNSGRNTSLAKNKAKSPVRVIYKLEASLMTQDSDVTSNDEFDDKVSNPKKRVYSPSRKDKHKSCTLSSLDITPKPVSKMQKRWNTPEDKHNQVELKADNLEESIQNKSPRKTVRDTKPEAIAAYSLQLCTVPKIYKKSPKSEMNEDSSSTEPSQTISFTSQCDGSRIASSVVLSSVTSRKSSKYTLAVPSFLTSGTVSKMDWQPESSCSEFGSKIMEQSDSAANLIARIEMMPFMGRDCIWESRRDDLWAFLLLRSRLRLTVRYHGACTNADTRVASLALEHTHEDTLNPLASLCVSFASEAMRFQVRRGCGTCGAVTARLRALAAAARLAARWARAMHEARARLGYTLTHDGWITLKVANSAIPALWEVTLQLELVVEDAMCAPWPCASVRRVACVTHRKHDERALDAGLARLAAATPRDWGHAPRTLWRVFKFLKHKKLNDFTSTAT